MRCKNCGWPNEDNVTRCIKCNSPLTGSFIGNNNQNNNAGGDDSLDNPANLKATLRDCSGGNISSDNNADNGNYGGNNGGNNGGNGVGGFCHRCGYPVSPGMDVCPSCNTPLSGANRNNYNNYNNNGGGGQFQGGRYAGGTVNPWARPQGHDGFCQLKRIPWQNENINYDPISYSGNEIILNRANTDPNNNSITSKEQAVIMRDGDDWYLQDRSSQQTTLIRAGRPIKLEDGDIIVMGNRMFEFHK